MEQDIWIEPDRWNRVVRIYIRQDLNDKTRVIHSLNSEGVAQADESDYHSSIKKPYLTIPVREFEDIKKLLVVDELQALEKLKEQLQGEIRAKELHIENLNRIFTQTLDKVK